MRTKIIYEDEQVLVCCKPAGLATQSGRVGQADMVSELKKYLAGAGKETMLQNKGLQLGRSAPYLGIIHRLDQPVTGLLVFAKTKDAAAGLTAQLEKGSLNKQYYAVVCGKPEREEGQLVDYLVKEKDMARVSKAGSSEEGARQAILQYRLVYSIMAEVEGDKQALSLLDIHIDTGRFHQIRVQMAHAGLPLIGDSKYGTRCSKDISNKLGVRNVALYAYRIEFVHPKTGKKMEFQTTPELAGGFGNIS